MEVFYYWNEIKRKKCFCDQTVRELCRLWYKLIMHTLIPLLLHSITVPLHSAAATSVEDTFTQNEYDLAISIVLCQRSCIFGLAVCHRNSSRSLRARVFSKSRARFSGCIQGSNDFGNIFFRIQSHKILPSEWQEFLNGILKPMLSLFRWFRCYKNCNTPSS